ncbi:MULTISPECIES: LytR C-terminal domain-containing protein [Actinotignum]|uniref:LytR C-terminal domain-containing protein n=1 Tax=Actinotignum timonense TaxID=1870995 RepID=A0AAW9HN27_9ACTO|nr:MULTISPECIES: LytR C-terminal domain-containing protein [Actinotignum]MBS5749224.1 LytR C-terminal domain-containing protein [Actinotignum schaalii]MDE1536735.1 LytR C-terminal domain-containing protein [Actinotignum schaalii]MDE1558718.1 LytR C-terminal domain-containing protein [Actinotignum schaalii]MDE1663791.1 LytR C-terminal domain-containing protein [Actinotignum schaalii]MDK6373942.1 LytR C-terminal domain-containing protein [Actinotignum timonense]
MTQQHLGPREAYRRKIQQRQTVVFSIVSGALALVFALCLLIWLGIIPSPINKEFAADPDPDEVTIPCLSGPTAPLELSKINANVYNSTSSSGLAAEVAHNLAEMGVTVGTTANWPAGVDKYGAIVQAGPDGLAAAYTLATFIPDSVVGFSNDTTGQTVTVILGEKFDALRNPEDAAAQLTDGQLTSPGNCVPVSEARK